MAGHALESAVSWGPRGGVLRPEGLIVCRSLEKEALESSLFEVRRQLAQLEARREQLEAEGQALLLAKEALTGMGGTGRWVRTPWLRPGLTWRSLGAHRSWEHWLWSLADPGSNPATRI